MASPTSASTDCAIDARNLRKAFDSKVAVRSLSLHVPRGTIFGFLGPNGAGKSTSIKMLLGLVRPTSGDATVLGARVGDVDVRRRIGFLPEDFRFYDWLTAAELLQFHGRLCGMTAAQLHQRVPAMLDLVELAEHRDRRLRGFSKGMLQRIGLAQALIHEPDLVFLDEPTSGLDPMGRRLVRDILRAERDRGATVFLNSHLLSEIEVTCDEVVFIKEGEVVAHRDLRGRASEELRIVARARNVSETAISGLARWTSSAHIEAEQLSFTAHSEDVLPDIMRHLVAYGTDVYSLTPQREALEELFVRIMGEDRSL